MFKWGLDEGIFMVASDWTERHRPLSERQLEGNEAQRKKFALGWTSGWREDPQNQVCF